MVDQDFQNNKTFQVTPENSSPDLRFGDGQFQWQGECNGEEPCIWGIRDETPVLRLLNEVREPRQAQDFFPLDPSECIRIYTGGFMQEYSDLLVVSNATQNDSPILWTRYPQRILTKDKRTTNHDSYHWVCHVILDNSKDEVCSRKAALDALKNKPWTVYGHPVDHCLARIAPDRCHLQ